MSLPAPGPDRAALVTGASSGIGAEIARELARRGHQLILVARSEDKLQALAEELRGTGAVAHVLPADLSDATARAALPERVGSLGVGVEVLVNNAGLSTVGPVASADPAAELGMVEVDVASVVDLTTRFLPGMVDRGRGALLNVASTAAFQPLPGQAAYAASKAFVLSYTQAVAAEVAGSGVTVTALCPGPVATDFVATAGFTDEEAHQAMPKVMWLPVEEVAKAAVAGMAKGRKVVIPGAANRVSAMAAQVTPRSLLLPVLAKGHPGLKRDRG
ncbi:SDR family NAD(P)-dependent oxidoreductase [Nocardioides limicola]|uniref:SDR family NAD(P)-dependent oxidoreductase n=1 Tax=Nocardioides limicola TaxID=2803368 RepID=UPI00193C5528|nr:SDR family oxidoreductase [Nocardioides sp. DJM-14]